MPVDVRSILVTGNSGNLKIHVSPCAHTNLQEHLLFVTFNDDSPRGKGHRLGLLFLALSALAIEQLQFTFPRHPALTLNDDVRAHRQAVQPFHKRFPDRTRGDGDRNGIKSTLEDSLRGGGATERSLFLGVKSILQKNFLLVGMTCAVTLARVFPGVSTSEIFWILCPYGKEKDTLLNNAKIARNEWRHSNTK
jgi:hypothetical protein